MTGVAKWEVNRLYEAGLDDNLIVFGHSLPLPVAGQGAALATIVVSFVAWAAAWSAFQEQVRAGMPPLSPAGCHKPAQGKDCDVAWLLPPPALGISLICVEG